MEDSQFYGNIYAFVLTDFINNFFYELKSMLNLSILQMSISFFGLLLVGVAFRYIPFIVNSLIKEKSWETILRQIAFVLILIRCGVGLNAAILKKSMVNLLMMLI